MGALEGKGEGLLVCGALDGTEEGKNEGFYANTEANSRKRTIIMETTNLLAMSET